MKKQIIGLTGVICALVGLSAHAAPLLLKSGRIDVGAKTPNATLATLSSAGESSTTKYIVQSDGKITAAWRRALERTGARILRYIPDNAYLVSASENAVANIRANVTHAALLPYLKAYRIDPQVQKVGSTATADKSGTNVAAYVISLFSTDVRDVYVAKINAMSGCRVLRADGAVIRAELTAAGVDRVSGLDEVEYVALWTEPHLHNNVAVQAPRMNVEAVWPGGANSLGLTGAGQVVAVADTGLDTGNLDTVHEDVRGRITRTYARGRSNDWSDTDGHGTHVVGSVLGNGSHSGSPKIRGIAYEASLILQSTLDSNGGLNGLPDDLNELFDEAYEEEGGQAGARIHSNSWGALYSAGAYTEYSRQIDHFCFVHPDMLVLFSAGNDGVDNAPCDGVIDTGSVSAPSTAKNCLTVGASENYRTSGGYAGDTWGLKWPSDYAAKPIKGDYISRSADGVNQGMAAYSSRGPCDDGRTKPDIVAPGTDVLSMRSSCGGTMWGWYDSYYQYCGGTSMSCPLVAGASTLVRQWLVRDEGISNPDGATIKALLLAGAKSLTPGQYGADAYREIPAAYPNNVEGWGQVNLGKTLSNGSDIRVYDAQVIQSEESQTNTFDVTAAGGSLTVIMAYADAPAALSSAKQLVNDLDLMVVSPSGIVYYPNSMDEPDRLNNVEGVRIARAEAGTYKVIVTGYDVNTGMDTSLTGGKENALRYSLVINAIGNSSPLASITVTGPSRVEGGTSATYSCTATYEDGSTRVVAPTWCVTNCLILAAIDEDGVLTTESVSSVQQLTVFATYEEGGTFTCAAMSVDVTKPLTIGEALNNTNLTFTTGGVSPWFVQTEETHDGEAALQSGPIGHGETNWVETTVTGPGKISFWWNADCEGSNWDYLYFSVDGERKGKIGGTDCEWTRFAYVLPEGQHTLRWVYWKDVSVSDGRDAGFLDEVSWEAGEFDPEPCTVYVSADEGDDGSEGLDEDSPKRTIQAAIDAVVDGSTIIVKYGEYGPIVTSNRVLTIRSEDGVYSATIDGGGTSRCADLGSEVSHTNTVLIGFTLQNGCAEESGGGGVRSGQLRQCILRDNEARWGGGAYLSTLSGCLLVDNRATYGGGSNSSRLYNCTVTRNEATESGGGAIIGGWDTKNCIIWGNDAPTDADVCGGPCTYTCAGTWLSGEGNICADPKFFNPDEDNFILRYDSPCLDAGNNDAVVDDVDLEGYARIANGWVDMGALEGFLLEAPSDVSASDGTSTESVTITWSPVDGADYYTVYRTDTESFSYWSSEYLGWTDETAFEDWDCAAGRTYWYWVSSESDIDGGYGSRSDSDSGYRFSFFSYEVYDREAYITGYNGTDTDVDIPDKIDGYTVIGIAESAFSGCRRIRSVTIPDSVMFIEDYAFEDCSCLTSVTIPDSMEQIGEGAFTGCSGLRSVTVPKCVCEEQYGFSYSFDIDTVTKIELADGVKYIAAYAFYDCYKLTSVSLPDSLKWIDDYAFGNCSSLRTITIPDHVYEVGRGAFSGCESLLSVVLPDEFEYISNYMFEGCSALRNVTLPSELRYIGEYAFSGCYDLADITIPDSVQRIDDGAFEDCLSLTTLTVPSCVCEEEHGLSRSFDVDLITKITVANEVRRIADYAFYDCNKLTSVTLSDSLRDIGEYAFGNCSSLKRITIPDDVYEIGEGAFSGCESLSSVVLPGELGYMRSMMFEGCVALKSVTMPGELRRICDYAFSGCCELTGMTIPDHVYEIGEGAFFECESLSSVVIPDGVSCLSGYVFKGCVSLRHVTLPSELRYIGEYAFSGCYDLAGVTFPDRIEEIREGAFENCIGLTSVALPNAIGSVEHGAFYGCDSLTRVTVPRVVVNAGLSSVFDTSLAADIIIADGVEEVTGYAFYELEYIPSVTLPDSVTSIRKYAFEDCTSLRRIVLPRGVETIECGAFYGCTALTDVVIPLGVTSIEDKSFRNCEKLAGITIPSSVTSIGNCAFEDCCELRDIVFEGNAPTVGEDAFGNVDPYCIVWVERASTDWGVSIPGTWQGLDIQYVPYYSYAVCGDNLVATQSSAGWQVASKDAAVLTQADIDSVKITAMLSDGSEADTTKGYCAKVSADGKSASFLLKTPSVGVEEEGEAEKDPDDPSGMLVDVDESELATKPTAKAGESVGALPVKAVKGLWYRVSWGADLEGMTQGAKIQADGDSLYLGVIKQSGFSGFYKLSVSEK